MAEPTEVLPIDENPDPKGTAGASQPVPPTTKPTVSQQVENQTAKKAAQTVAAQPVRSQHQVIREKLAFSDYLFLAIENPVLRRELLTSLRSNRAFIMHFIFVLLLGMVVYLAWPDPHADNLSERARTLFRVFGRGQLVLLSVLAPAFSASAMTVEKEKRCLDLLLTSPIHPNTILIGKYLSSIVYLMLLVGSTAPIVSITFWQPGIDPNEVIGLYGLLLSVAACFGMIGMSCSVFFHRTQTSLTVTYMIVLPIALLLLTFATIFDTFFDIKVALWPSGLMLLAALIMYQACVRRMRQPFDPVFKAAEEEDLSSQTGLVLVQDRFPDNLLAPPRNDSLLPENSNPIFQKEIRSEIFGRGTLFLRLIIQISMFLSVVFLTFLYLKREHTFVDYLIVFTMLVAPAFACNVFTQERERGTLDLLLTTLIRPGQVVTGKFLSCIRLSVFLTGLVGVTLLFFLLVGLNGESGSMDGKAILARVIAFSVYLGIIAVTILLETSLGMLFSMICATTLQSMIVTYSTLLVIFCVPIAAGILLVTFAPNMDTTQIEWASFISPFQAAYSVTPKPRGQSNEYFQPQQVWTAYLAFAGFMSMMAMGYVYRFFPHWATRTVKPL